MSPYRSVEPQSVLEKMQRLTASAKANRQKRAQEDVDEALKICLSKIEESANDCCDACYIYSTSVIGDGKISWTEDLRKLLITRLMALNFIATDHIVFIAVSWKVEEKL